MKLFIFLQIYLVKLLFPKYYLLPTSLIYAQAKHETGNFTSPIYLYNKNLFGMKLPRIRDTTATGSERGHATYSNYLNSIYDYFLRQEAFNINYISTNQYVEKTFSTGYAEDHQYREKWLSHYFQMGITRYFGFVIIPFLFLTFLYVFFDEKISSYFNNTQQRKTRKRKKFVRR